MGKSLDPTIALFAKLPVPGGVKTRLQPTAGRAGAARLAAAMLVDRLKFVDELKDDTGHGKLLCGDRAEVTPFLPYLAQAWGQPLGGGRINSGQGEIPGSTWRYRSQGSGGLGQRIFRVLQDYRQGGCIVIGTDAVAQNFEALKNALEILGEGRSVIQPAKDGGFTLLGLPAGNPAEGWDPLEAVLSADGTGGFSSSAISWGVVSAALAKSGWPPQILVQEIDVDEWSDVESLIESSSESPGRVTVMTQFLQELSFIPKDVWRVSVEMPILRAGEASPTAPAEKE